MRPTDLQSFTCSVDTQIPVTPSPDHSVVGFCRLSKKGPLSGHFSGAPPQTCTTQWSVLGRTPPSSDHSVVTAGSNPTERSPLSGCNLGGGGVLYPLSGQFSVTPPKSSPLSGAKSRRDPVEQPLGGRCQGSGSRDLPVPQVAWRCNRLSPLVASSPAVRYVGVKAEPRVASRGSRSLGPLTSREATNDTPNVSPQTMVSCSRLATSRVHPCNPNVSLPGFAVRSAVER